MGKTKKDFGDVWFYHCDHLGTPQEMTDYTGSIIWKAEYKAWGECKAEKAKSSFFENSEIITNNIHFQGQYFDQETGLHYNRYRYYSPYVGRFVSKDPIGLDGGMNIYAYSINPITWVDALGLAPKKPKPQQSSEPTGVVCSLTNTLKSTAQGLVLIKPGTKQWMQAVQSMKNGGNTNFLVSNIEDAKKLLSDARGNMNKMPRYTEVGYTKGYEIHPSEATTNNAPHNNLDHLKWKDFSKNAKSSNNCGKGHIFFDSKGSVPPFRKGE